MTQEEKSLLLLDLCARLPYGVIVDIKYNKEHGSSDRLRICSEGSLTLNTDLMGLCIEEEIYLKPYLRPMSNMTEEEKKEYKALCIKETFTFGTCQKVVWYDTWKSIDWLNKKMFDYRTDDEGKTMTEKGIVLKAPEGMYK